MQSERRFAPCWHSSGHLKRLRREARWPRGQLHPRGTVGLPRTAGAGLDSPRLARTGGTLTSQELRGLPGKGGLRVGSLAGTRAPDTLPQPGGRSLGGLPLGADELKCSFLGRHAFFISTSLSPRKFFPTSSLSSRCISGVVHSLPSHPTEPSLPCLPPALVPASQASVPYCPASSSSLGPETSRNDPWGR